MTTAYRLTEDRRTLVITRRTPAGIQTATYRRQKDAGPFTADEVAAAVSATPAATGGLPGQRNITRRAVTRFGALYTHVMLGPPTWWAPRVRRDKDGTVMTGWLRLAVAVKFARAERPAPAGEGK